MLCRPRHIDFKGERKFSRLIIRDRQGATAEIANNYNSGDPNSASQHTVQRALLRMGLRTDGLSTSSSTTPETGQ